MARTDSSAAETGDRTSRSAFIAATAGALVVAQMVAGKAARDALFLSNHLVAQLPMMMLASAVVSSSPVEDSVARALRSIDRWPPGLVG